MTFRQEPKRINILHPVKLPQIEKQILLVTDGLMTDQVIVDQKIRGDGQFLDVA